MKLRYRYVSYGAGRDRIEQIQEMHQLMHQMLARATTRGSGSWQPPTDVYETGDAIVVQVELAGTREEDIDITLFADHLTIAGTRQNRAAEAATAYYLAGILYGAFTVTVPVTANVDRDGVEAAFDNGLLIVTLPKTTGPKPSTISIGTTTAAATAQAEPHDVLAPQGAER